MVGPTVLGSLLRSTHLFALSEPRFTLLAEGTAGQIWFSQYPEVKSLNLQHYLKIPMRHLVKPPVS